MSYEFRIVIGLDTKGRLPESYCEQCVRQLAKSIFPHGHTIIEAEGVWKTGSERTLIVQWFATAEQKHTGEAHNKVSRFAGTIKNKLLQDAVLVCQYTPEVWTV